MKPLVIFSTLIEKPHCVVLQVRAAAAAVELATAGHRLAALNVCFAYTGRHDQLQAMHAVQVRAPSNRVSERVRERRWSWPLLATA
jgi:undecaprenyl pyrophosphate synthase